MVVRANISEENRTQNTVLNYCAQAKAMLKYVQKSKEKLHWSGRGTAFILMLCIHLRLDPQIYQQSLLFHTVIFSQSMGKKLSKYFPHILNANLMSRSQLLKSN
jgi:hypothetical protein